ncbi:MAG: hypothetical protein Q9167_003490 [Letrouitia subvulpina]
MDNEILYCWHVLPIGAYLRNEGAIINEESGFVEDIRKTQAFKLLSTDSESRLVVNFHGNAGDVAQGWRTDTYRAVASGAPDKIHVLAFDYRGFGYSSGSPTERGLIIDGVSLVKWALEVAKIPSERIVLLGQSLGTAVATAVAEDFALNSNIDFAGIILVASFSDIPTLLLTYTIKGIIPILSPLRAYPSLQRFFSSKVLDIWSTANRVRSLIRSSRKINLSLIHAKNDIEIPWSHTEKLFYVAANATSIGLTTMQIDSVKGHQDLGNGGFLDTWNADGMKKISKEIVKQGGK